MLGWGVRMRRSSKFLLSAALPLTLALAAPAGAQFVSAVEEDLRRQLEEMQVRNADSQARIEALEERLGALEAATGLATQDADLLSDEDQATLRGRGDPRPLQPRRSEERRVGKECASTGKSRGSPSP